MDLPRVNSAKLSATNVADSLSFPSISMRLFGKKQGHTIRSFEDVANAELPMLYRIAKRLTRNSATAEDLVAQTLLDASKGWDNFSGEHPRAWLIRILRNNFSKSVRSSAARPSVQALDEVECGVSQDFLGDLNWKLIGSRILTELEMLPEEYRMAVVLCDVEELPYQEAADILEVPVGTIRSRLSRGRQLLRTRLAHLVEGDFGPMVTGGAK